jgi:eukaryotic-like serine/threonine-protein kinase
MSAFAWSPDGKFFASGSARGLIQLWDATTYTLIRTFEDHSTALVTSIAWSPDGSRLASGSRDKTVQVWQAV